MTERIDKDKFLTIPMELRKLKQFVCYKLEDEGRAKPAKIPYNPVTGKKVKVNDPSTYCSFTEAYAHREEYDGLGFVLTKKDQYGCIDLDCHNGNGLSPQAKDLIKKFNTYSEYSLNGGAHIWFIGQKPGPASRKGEIEIYTHGRYIVMTGDQIPGAPLEIENRQVELNKLYEEVFSDVPGKGPELPPCELSTQGGSSDAEVIERAKRAANGEKFNRLMGGDISGNENNHSSADMALCSLLSFYTQDADQIDRIFRTSGLMRDKWDVVHFGGNVTYGARTIDKMVDKRKGQKVWKPGASKVNVEDLEKVNELLLGVEGEDRKGACEYLARHYLKELRGNVVKVKGILDTWNVRNTPSLEDAEILAIIASERAINKTTEVIRELNKKHGVIMLGGKCVVLNETVDYTFNRPEITFSNPRDFKDFYANRFVQITTGEGKEKSIPLGKYWFESKERRQFKGITFAPLKDTPVYYNLWKGFAVEPKEGDCPLYLDHLWINVAQENQEIYDYLIAWMADCVQNPTDKPGTSIVLRGRQGTGKGVALSEFGKLLGNHYIHLQHTRHLVGNFNAHLKDALLIFADEAFWAGDKSAEGVLKTMITEEFMQIEPKGKDSFRVKNYIHLMISSNNDWIVPAGLEERRFLILDIGEKHIQDHGYFKNIIDQMNNGGREALLYFLQNYDLSGVNLRKIPQTEALLETKLLSMTLIQKFWFAKLRAGALFDNADSWNEGPVSVEIFKEQYYNFANKAGNRYKGDETELGIGLRKLMPWLKRVRPSESGKRYYAYKFPSLIECRKFWENLINAKIAWPKQGAALINSFMKLPDNDENEEK